MNTHKTAEHLHMGTVAIQLKGAHTHALSGIRDAGYRPQLCVCVSISICQRPGLTSSAPSLTSHTAKSFVPRLWFMTGSWRWAQRQCVITWDRVCLCLSFSTQNIPQAHYFLSTPLMWNCMFPSIHSSLQRAQQGFPGESGSSQHSVQGNRTSRWTHNVEQMC